MPEFTQTFFSNTSQTLSAPATQPAAQPATQPMRADANGPSSLAPTLIVIPSESLSDLDVPSDLGHDVDSQTLHRQDAFHYSR